MRWLAVGLLGFGCSGEEPGKPGHDLGSDPDGTSTEVGSTLTTPSDTQVTSVAGPTWYRDIAPLLADRCGSCHQEGGVAPFSIASYDTVSPWGPAIEDDVRSGAMPPFFAVEDSSCEVRLPWKDDISLSAAEKQEIYDWVDAGMPEGDPATAAPAELRPIEELTDYDVELPLQQPFTVGGNEDIYECFRIPVPNAVPVWLTDVQVVPDNDLVVHHVIVWSDPDDQSAGSAGSDGAYDCSGFPDIFPTEIVGTWTPGTQPIHAPPGTGTPMNVGQSLILNVHYHPTGTSTEIDQTKIRLKWTDQEPERYATWSLVDLPFGATNLPDPSDHSDRDFLIPANEPAHVETNEMWFTSLLFSADMTVFAVTPHMHYLGTDMLVTVKHQGNEPDECLIHTPNYRFDFQRDYVYDGPRNQLPVIHPGERVDVRCTYDNTTDNPFMPAHLAASGATEPQDVWWGETTGDEMCMAIVGLIVPKSGWSPFSWF